MNNEPVVVGIDYSMTSPSICVHSSDTWDISHCKFFYLTHKKKLAIKSGFLFGDVQREFLSQEHRFDILSTWAVSHVPQCASVYIEDYAFAAKGFVFHIGECAGMLKHRLWSFLIPFKTVSPSAIKKFATGKGNANKLAMYHSFVEETRFDISSVLDCHEGESPMSDIIDSYFIAKYGFFHMKQNNLFTSD